MVHTRVSGYVRMYMYNYVHVYGPSRHMTNSSFLVVSMNSPIEGYMIRGEHMLTEEQFVFCCEYAKNGDLESIKNLLDNEDEIMSSLCCPRPVPSSPLVLAAQYGHVAVVQYLIRKFPSCSFIDFPCTVFQIANTGDELHHCTALNAASVCGHVEIVQLLLEAGASHCIADCTGATPFVEATYHGQFPVLQVLHKFGADINAVNSSGWSAFLIAIKKCSMKVLQYLLKIRVDVTQKTPEGFGAMLVATETSAVIAKFLLKQGLSPEFSEGDGNYKPCPLYLAAFTHQPLFDMLSLRPDCPVRCQSDSLLLRGIHTLTQADLHLPVHMLHALAYERWANALHQRSSTNINVIPLPPCDAYGGRTEVLNIDELAQTCDPILPNSYVETLYQALIIMERCIGGSLHVLYENMIHFAKVFSELGLFQDAGKVCLRILHLVNLYHLPLLKRGYCPPQNYEMFYSEIVKKMLQVLGNDDNAEISLSSVESFLPFIFNVLDSLIERIEAEHAKYGCLKGSPRILLQLVIKIFSDWLPLVLHSCDHDSEQKWESHGCTFVKKFLLLPDGSNLVHIVLDSPFICNTKVFEFLLHWGAEKVINVLYEGKNCLQKATTLSMRSIFNVLVDQGAHLDAVDSNGKSVLDEYPNLMLKYGPIPLACLAARVIIRDKIPYNRLLCIPPGVKTFIEMHDANVH